MKSRLLTSRCFYRTIRALVLCGLVLTSAAFAATPTPAVASRAGEPLRVASMFSDNMVLQRGKPVPVWGWAAPGESVVVRLAGQEKRATVDADGKWMVKLDALKAGGGPLEMTVEGKTTVLFKNVLVGEVWVCSGQSNMQMRLADLSNVEGEAKGADLPEIRVFNCYGEPLIEPQTRNNGAWFPMAPSMSKQVSAVAYFFGRQLHHELKVPVGLIIGAVGGTCGEFWISRQGLEKDPELKYFVEEIDKTVAMYPPKDDQGWEKPGLDDAAWKTMKAPVNWKQGWLPGSGVVWFRKTLDIPAAWAGKELKFHSGPLRRSDITWFNGQKIGETSEAPEKPREYSIPAAWVKPGRAVLVTRITSGDENWAGILGKPEELNLSVAGTAGGDSTISLAGDWKYDVAKLSRVGTSTMATTLYNSYIAPVVPYAIQGAIWYQGESNIDKALQYRRLLPALIRDWRAHWGQGDFPFGIVQLTSFGEVRSTLGPSDWAELREAQLLTAKTVPNTGLAVTIDNADRRIHSENKQDVGLRLGLWALSTVYGKKDVFSGPIYKSMAIEGSKIRVTFDQIGGGLEAKGGTLKEFAIAGSDQKFVWANATIDGGTVVVSSDQIGKPVAVRYAWSASPANPNLYNKEGLPASPFRTDDSGMEEATALKANNAAARKQAPPVQLIFDGDFITCGWHDTAENKKIWDTRYAKLGAVNFGVPDIGTQGTLRRIPLQVEGLHPKLIVLLIGTNDLWLKSGEQIAEGIKAIIWQYQRRCPNATILVQAIFPREQRLTDYNRGKIKEINALTAKYADGKKVVYIDLGDKFLQADGSINPELMPDFLHLSARGYQTWANAIQPFIDRYVK